jgi:hypothetical protein
MTFRVHEAIIRQSTFFVNALKPEWTSAREGRPIDLKDEDPDIFAAYVQWLYTHQLDSTFSTIKWSKMYALGGKFMDLEFQDVVLDLLICQCDKYAKYPGQKQVSIIYEGTTTGSPARRLLVDQFSWVGGESWVKGQNLASKHPPEFINDLLEALMVNKKKLIGDRPWVADKTAYFVGSRKKSQ